ncbi:MAG: hypothetical protein JO132_13315 [Streptosporangiaceae bacterium]|nr:hypothetical protein [Streptosporangiaceae bacterium]
MTDERGQSELPKPEGSGEEMIGDLEAPAEVREGIAGGREDSKCECAATTVV